MSTGPPGARYIANPAWLLLPWLDRCSGGLKGSESYPFHITAQLVANAVWGAQRIPGLAAMQPAVASGGDTSSPLAPEQAATVTQANSTIKDADSSSGVACESAELQASYRHLCASLLLCVMKRALSMSEADADALLEHYDVGASDPVAGNAYMSTGEGTGGISGTSALEQQLCNASAADVAPAIFQAEAAAREADVMDDDDCVYEDMDAVPSSNGGGGGGGGDGGSSNGAGHDARVQPGSILPGLSAMDRGVEHLNLEGPFMSSGRTVSLDDECWSRLRAKLLHLGGHTSYSVLNGVDVWSDPSTLATLLELIRVLGVHDRGRDLEALLARYMGLLAERLSDAPADMGCLPAAWQALGMDALIAAPRSHARSVLAALPPEAGIMLGLVNRLAMALAPPAGPASARALLWRQLHSMGVLSLCARVLSDLSTLEASPGGCSACESVAGVLLFYVLERPGGVDVARQFLSAGVVRALSMLLPKYEGGDGEPLRLLALVLSSCSSDVAAWMLAVPAVQGWLGGSACAPGGIHQAHGALWKLLATAAAGGTAASKVSDAGPGQLLSLLDAGQLEQLYRTLLLMQAVHHAADGRVAWGKDVQARLTGLGADLRTRASSISSSASCGRTAASDSNGAEAASNQGGVESSTGKGKAVPAGTLWVGSTDDGDEGHDDGKAPAGTAVLAARREARLLPECARIVKGLLTIGGKTE